ncbi:hypothetical protein [uncultured Streptomyces sp.]|uniref:hypothetical protein n=1 Tax=uncultured Streptomyces sp. TaxID=174707 RepID=UPI00261847AF|nr:hypothetical protein [uncultured Streptomyces sp.]
MIRTVLGSAVALAGAAVAVLSPFRDWYGGRLGRSYRVRDLFGDLTPDRPPLLMSLLLPFVLAAVLAVLGVLLRQRLLVALAGLVALGFTVLWMVRLGQAEGGLIIAGDGSGLGRGVAGAAGGGVLLLLGAVLMPGRRSIRRRRPPPYTAPGSAHPDTWPPTPEPGPAHITSPWPEPEPEPYTGPPSTDRRAARGGEEDTLSLPTVAPSEDRPRGDGTPDA